jgi:hypothetical protein
MARDRSLDEFLGEASGEDAGSDGEAVEHPEGANGPEEPSPDGTDGDADPDTGRDTEPEDTDEGEGGAALPPDAEVPAVEMTMAFAPEGAECTACGATVERRWQGDGRLVCGDCKEW